MKNIIIIIGLFLQTYAFSQINDGITVLSAAEFSKVIKVDSIQLIDVRTPEEFREGHLGNALNVDFLDPETFYIEVNNLNKERPVYLYCRSGNRSGKATLKLDSLGFKSIYDLKGGYINYPNVEDK